MRPRSRRRGASGRPPGRGAGQQHYATTADLLALETRLVKEMGKQVKWLIVLQLLGVTAVASIMVALAAIMKL